MPPLKIMDKRAAHVGMILSFLVFMTFLAFLYSVTQPLTNVQRDKLDTLEYLKTELIKNFSEDMSTIIVDFLEVPDSNCVTFGEFDAGLEKWGAVVKKIKIEENRELPEERAESRVEEDGSITISGTEKKIKFYYSTPFPQIYGTPCPQTEPLSETTYDIVLFRTTEHIFDSIIIDVAEGMENNGDYYQNLKDELGLAFDDEFGFIFSDKDKNIIAIANQNDANIDTYSEELPIQFINSSNADLMPGFLSIQIW